MIRRARRALPGDPEFGDPLSAAGEGGPRVFLRADRSLDYGRVMRVMGEINAAGLRKVALVSTQGGET